MNGVEAPDFVYREAQRHGYLARSAFKGLKAPIAKISGSNQLKSKGLRMELTITQHDDWHLHLSDSDLLKVVFPYRLSSS
ncbi:hypothetical protein Dsin_027663 [Dipteronia sinensis]|uniref:Uncharacterized protein n=1 Tax=Dipteronia sinensis TaxID=43782 RepID=A0AAD9ZPD7_9ROSI|nr:hypothetical protein Dsin_027663 [Dipteronia sinensis]